MRKIAWYGERGTPYVLALNQDPQPHRERGSRASGEPAKLFRTPALPSSQWDLVRTHRNWPQLGQFICMARMLFGGSMFGNLVDRSVVDKAGSRSKGMGPLGWTRGETGTPEHSGRDTQPTHSSLMTGGKPRGVHQHFPCLASFQ